MTPGDEAGDRSSSSHGSGKYDIGGSVRAGKIKFGAVSVGARAAPAQPAPHGSSSYFVLKLQLAEPVPIRFVAVERTL